MTDESTTWESLLDRLEADLVIGEFMVKNPGVEPAEPEPWTAPQLSTPLPEELVERVLDLHARQQTLLAEMAQSRTALGNQIKVIDRIQQATGPAERTPLFIDTSA